MVEGILWVGAGIKEGSAMTHGQFNKWYSQIHVPDVLNTGAANFAIRFKNLDDARKFKYLAAYNVPSLSDLSIQGLMVRCWSHLGSTVEETKAVSSSIVAINCDH